MNRGTYGPHPRSGVHTWASLALMHKMSKVGGFSPTRHSSVGTPRRGYRSPSDKPTVAGQEVGMRREPPNRGTECRHKKGHRKVSRQSCDWCQEHCSLVQHPGEHFKCPTPFQPTPSSPGQHGGLHYLTRPPRPRVRLHCSSFPKRISPWGKGQMFCPFRASVVPSAAWDVQDPFPE